MLYSSDLWRRAVHIRIREHVDRRGDESRAFDVVRVVFLFNLGDNAVLVGLTPA